MGDKKKRLTLHSHLKNSKCESKDNGIWCNGNTADSGPAIPGSSPGIPTFKEAKLLEKVI